MTRGAAAVVKLLCIEWLQGNVGEAVAENASSVLEAKGKTLVCMSMCASAPAAYERLCECFSLPLLKVIYVFHTWGRVCCLHQSCCCWWKGVKVGRLSEERHRASGAPMSAHPRHLETLCHSARTAFAPLATGWEDIHTGAHINMHIINEEHHETSSSTLL